MGVTLPEGIDHHEAMHRLVRDGWTAAARGDWAWVFRSPSGGQAARVCPYDPAYELHIANCRRLAGNPYFQRVDEVVRLGRHGHVVVMEWLEPCDEERAAGLCRRIGLGRHAPPEADESCTGAAFDGDRHLAEIRAALVETERRANRTLPYWGGFDIRPGNVMRDATGAMKVMDPFYVEGRRLFSAILEDLDGVLERLPLDAVRCFLAIAAFDDAEDDPDVSRARALVDAAARRAHGA